MKALVYQGPGKKALEERPKPAITDPRDAIVKVTKTTICGTDLHILKGDVATFRQGCQDEGVEDYRSVEARQEITPKKPRTYGLDSLRKRFRGTRTNFKRK